MRRFLRTSLTPAVVTAALVIMSAAAGMVAQTAVAGDAGTVSRFESKGQRLAEAAALAGRCLGIQVELGIGPTHPARERMATIDMEVNEPNDLLNALSASYGLRWLSGPGEKKVTLIDREQYRASPAGRRQALADGLPAELRGPLLHASEGRLGTVEGVLKELQTKSSDRLEAATANGPVIISKLPEEFRRPLLRYLNLFSVLRLGRACDDFSQELDINPDSAFTYGANASGTKQFSFQIGKSRWLSVVPE